MVKKNLIYIFLAALPLVSCEEVVEVELASTPPQLVVDALIGYSNTGDGSKINGAVILTLTAPFFENQTPPAANATVAIIDNQTGEIFPISENTTGIFDTGFPNFEFGRDYTLRIIYENQIYEATERLMRAGTIDRIIQGDGFLFDEEEETEVEITFSDVLDERNFYLFSFGFENFLVTDDEFYQNSNLTFSFFYEEIGPGDTVDILLLGITQQFGNFVDLTLVQAGQNMGGPFMVPPATVRGNIVNTTENSNFAFGYFSLSEFDTVSLTIE